MNNNSNSNLIQRTDTDFTDDIDEPNVVIIKDYSRKDINKLHQSEDYNYP